MGQFGEGIPMSEGRKGELAAIARERVVEDPEILAGRCVLKGTRMPVHLVAKMRASGMSVGALLREYPSLTAELIEVAVLYAETYPEEPMAKSPSWRNEEPTHSVVVPRRISR